MNQREKLIELIGDSLCCPKETDCADCEYKKYELCTETMVADYLLDKGVVVLPCKVGDTVYEVRNNKDVHSKLIELLDKLDVYDDWLNNKTIADLLIANGVVVLPCRCCECEHCDIGQNDVEQWCICKLHFGKYIDVDPTDFCSYAKRKGGEK